MRRSRGERWKRSGEVEERRRGRGRKGVERRR